MYKAEGNFYFTGEELQKTRFLEDGSIIINGIHLKSDGGGSALKAFGSLIFAGEEGEEELFTFDITLVECEMLPETVVGMSFQEAFISAINWFVENNGIRFFDEMVKCIDYHSPVFTDEMFYFQDVLSDVMVDASDGGKKDIDQDEIYTGFCDRVGDRPWMILAENPEQVMYLLRTFFEAYYPYAEQHYRENA